MSTRFDMDAFAASVTDRRNNLGLKQYEVAKEVGTSTSTICRVEQGQVPDVENLVKILAWLGVPLERFITGEDTTPISPKMLLAQRIRHAREATNLSQGDVARSLDMHRPTISEIEAGRRDVSALELLAFATMYGVEVRWLLTGKEDAA